MTSELERKVCELERLLRDQGRLLREVQAKLAMHESKAQRYKQIAIEWEQEAKGTRKSLEYYTKLSEHYMAQVHNLQRDKSTSYKEVVRAEVFRLVEATGNPSVLPHDLVPVLASVQSEVAEDALQQRHERLKDPTSHPLGLHPGVHEWGSFLAADVL